MFVFIHIIISTCIRNRIPINICICRHAHICIPHHIRIAHVVFPITQTPMQCSWDNAVQTLFNIVQHPLLDRYDSMSNMGSMLTLGTLLLPHTSKGMPHQHGRRLSENKRTTFEQPQPYPYPFLPNPPRRSFLISSAIVAVLTSPETECGSVVVVVVVVASAPSKKNTQRFLGNCVSEVGTCTAVQLFRTKVLGQV